MDYFNSITRAVFFFYLLQWQFFSATAFAAEQPQKGKEEERPISTALQQAVAEIELFYIQNIIKNLTGKQRDTLLNDKATFQKFIQSEADTQSILLAVLANKLDQGPYALFLIQRNIAKTLKETYINRLMQEKRPSDFPNEQQIADYYKKNKTQFMVGKRIHI